MIPAKVRIFVCTEAVDMRYGFDRLAAVARERIGEDPQTGSALFAFANRAKDRVKLLWFDRNGYCTLYKRFHRARPVLPEPGESGAAAVRIDAVALGKLLAGIERHGRVSHSRAGNRRG
jgi:transposase